MIIDHEKIRVQKIQMSADDTVRARDVSLFDIIAFYGFQRDRRDPKNNWETPKGRLKVSHEDPAKFTFFDLPPKIGSRGGAIDFMIALGDMTFEEAKSFLLKHFVTGSSEARNIPLAIPTIKPISKAPSRFSSQPMPKAAEKKKFTLPKVREDAWEIARSYLVDQRGLSPALVDAVHGTGRLYGAYIKPDPDKNEYYPCAVFVFKDQAGVEIRSADEYKFSRVYGEKSSFALKSLETDRKRVAFVESSIDALSLRQLGFRGKIISITGSAPKKSSGLAESHRQQGFEIIGAFDADEAGERACTHLGWHTRMAPVSGKDWNDQLLAGVPLSLI